MSHAKLMVMLPLMYLSRKIDGEDPDIIFILRCTYGTVQALILLSIAYVFLKVQKLVSNKWMQKLVIYVPEPAAPFSLPAEDAKKKYTRTTLAKHILSKTKNLGFSTAGSCCFTVALHLYRGMVIGLAMQSAMGPFGLYENTLAKAILLNQVGDGSDHNPWKKLRVFDEKYEHELTEKDEVVDDKGEVVSFKRRPVEDVLDVLWDTWHNAKYKPVDLKPLMERLNKGNVNMKTEETGWTPIMIVASIEAEGQKEALIKLKEWGAKPEAVDEEGWNALHWTAFHGIASGTRFLMKEFPGKGLEDAKDKSGKTALDHAKDEKNVEVTKILEELMRKTQ